MDKMNRANRLGRRKALSRSHRVRYPCDCYKNKENTSDGFEEVMVLTCILSLLRQYTCVTRPLHTYTLQDGVEPKSFGPLEWETDTLARRLKVIWYSLQSI